MTKRLPIVLDCDPGIDDTFAILTAAHHGHLLGITTVNGNVGLDHTTHNALIATQVADLETPVHRGAGRPLVEPPFDAARIHGATGLGSVELPELRRSVASDDAVGFICDTIRSEPGVHLVAVGPLTNVALALRRDPELPSLVSGVTIMGGAASVGNVTASAEFNVWADPEAAAAVFRDAAPVRTVGLDLTKQIVFGKAEAVRIRAAGTATSILLADLLDYYIERNQELGRKGASIHDAYAVLAATHPELFTMSMHPVEVELAGRHTRGMTVVDRRALPEGPTHAEVVWKAETAAVADLVIEAATAF